MSSFKPINITEGNSDCYSFEQFYVNIPKQMNSFKNLLTETIKQVKQMKQDGVTDEQMREANIAKTRRIKMKIQMLQLCHPDAPMSREKMGDMIEFAHGVIILAFLKAVPWGEDFGIFLADGSMPLIPKDQISGLMKLVADEAKKRM